MSYSIVPIATQSPGLFPAQGQTNFTRLKTIIGADHQFNDTAAGNDGFHNRISYINQVADPTIPAGANALGYSLDTDLGTGTSRTEVLVKNAEGSQVLGARAYVLFTVAAGVVTINSQFNVSGVTRNSIGEYTVTFSRPMKTAKFGTFALAQPLSLSGSGDVRLTMMRTGPNYTTAQTTTTTRIEIINSSGEFKDPGSCAVFVFGG